LGLVGQGAAWENRLMVDVFDRERMAERAADLAVQGVFRVRSSECRVFGNYLTGERRGKERAAGRGCAQDFVFVNNRLEGNALTTIAAVMKRSSGGP
jgi:hypothetical protein